MPSRNVRYVFGTIVKDSEDPNAIINDTGQGIVLQPEVLQARQATERLDALDRVQFVRRQVQRDERVESREAIGGDQLIE